MSVSRKPAVIRGFAGSSLAIFVALAGHVAAGGDVPGPLGILVPWMLSFMVCVLLSGRRLSLTRLSVSVAVSQFLFHTLFVLGSPVSSVTPGASTTGAHVHELVLPATSSSAALASSGSLMMWAGHALAAVVTIAALYRGERLLHSLRELAVQAARWVRHRLDAVHAVPRIRAVAITIAHEAPRRWDSPLLAALRGRAPPRSLSV